VGCERGAEPHELIGLVRDTLAAPARPDAVAGVFSLDLKADEPAVHALADDLGVAARFFSAARLNEESARLANPSEVVLREVGCPGVAEGAALAAAGLQGRLLVPKTRSARATCAVAKSPLPLLDLPGRPRGKLSVVGIGPGSRERLSPAAADALGRATDWVGYGLYLDLVAHLSAGKIEHRFALGAEEERVRKALALAGEGRCVALVSSGDAGIYAMGSLACELLDRGGLDAAAARVALEVIPGISAFQAAAARAGGLIGHDFCCISLSDLLTPGRRSKSACRRPPNPISSPRSTIRARPGAPTSSPAPWRSLSPPPPDTPVMVASSLGRPDEAVRVLPLAAFEPATWTCSPSCSSARPRAACSPAATARPSPTRRAAMPEKALMTVHFIGAGPGAPDLITVRGLKLIEAPLCAFMPARWSLPRWSPAPRPAPG
jgi:cobalt-precorrin 5A hydrolase / precorrin-3B C17-methyltransferase